MAGLVLHQAGNCVFSVRSRGKHVARFSVRLAAPARRSRNFLGASREAAQREPCRKRGEFFILRPRRAERPSQFSKSAQQRGRPGAQRLLGELQKSPLSYFDGGEPGTFRRVRCVPAQERSARPSLPRPRPSRPNPNAPESRPWLASRFAPGLFTCAQVRPRDGGIFGAKHFAHSGGTPSTTSFTISRALASSSEEASTDCRPCEVSRRTRILFSRRDATSMSPSAVSSPDQTSIPPPSDSHSASSPASGGPGMFSSLDGVSVSRSF